MSYTFLFLFLRQKQCSSEIFSTIKSKIIYFHPKPTLPDIFRKTSSNIDITTFSFLKKVKQIQMHDFLLYFRKLTLKFILMCEISYREDYGLDFLRYSTLYETIRKEIATSIYIFLNGFVIFVSETITEYTNFTQSQSFV